MEVFLFVLIDAGIVTTPVLGSNSDKVIVSHNFLLFMIPGVLPNAIFGTGNGLFLWQRTGVEPDFSVRIPYAKR